MAEQVVFEFSSPDRKTLSNSPQTRWLCEKSQNLAVSLTNPLSPQYLRKAALQGQEEQFPFDCVSPPPEWQSCMQQVSLSLQFLHWGKKEPEIGIQLSQCYRTLPGDPLSFHFIGMTAGISKQDYWKSARVGGEGWCSQQPVCELGRSCLCCQWHMSGDANQLLCLSAQVSRWPHFSREFAQHSVQFRSLANEPSWPWYLFCSPDFHSKASQQPCPNIEHNLWP